MIDTLTRTAASAAVAGTGWRYLLGTIATSVQVGSTAQALLVVQAVVTACGPDPDGHLQIDLRPDRVEVGLQTAAVAAATVADVNLSRRITDAVAALGLEVAGVTTHGGRRSVQMLEIAIDAIDIPAVRGFWKAVMGYADEPGGHGPTDPLVDPARQGPAIWFQQMDRPRTQRNRIHLDLTVPHDEADARVQAALAAGGVLVSDAAARSFWILADTEGNEVCICTWQDRE
jgi:4a-hydroxytetrahydrobiopterin dehydratase